MIRQLLKKDADNMLKCLLDKETMQYMQLSQAQQSLEKCQAFIENSFTERNQHFAIVNENDEWVGTISLKNIDHDVGAAEYAIITARSIHGKGVAYSATQELLKYAFHDLGLNRVYLNVIKDNIRANKFYIKCGFEFEGCFRQAIRIGEKLLDLNWYAIIKKDYVWEN